MSDNSLARINGKRKFTYGELNVDQEDLNFQYQKVLCINSAAA